jgi:uncharacterized protein with von Willebrand factor type A (vWA) domain
MFIDFFYSLKNAGIQVSPTSFLTLQKALNMGLINSLDEFYTSARAILVKSERYFDVYDQIFAHRFEGAELPEYQGFEIDDISRAMLDEWLKDPQTLAQAPCWMNGSKTPRPLPRLWIWMKRSCSN